MVISLLLPLVGDVETHGTVLGGGPAYLAIDEDPDDGDATRIRILDVNQVEASRIDASALPSDALVTAVRVKWNASGTVGEPASARAGLRVAGTDYWANERGLTAAAYGGAYTETWATNPASGDPWTPAEVAGVVPIFETTFQAPGELHPRLTQRVLYVDYVNRHERSDAEPESLAPEAGPVPLGPAAAPSGLAPGATGSSHAPAASVAGQAPTSKPVTITPSADPSTRAPMADPAKLNTYSARPVALAPVALAPEALPPTAAPVALDPEGNPG